MSLRKHAFCFSITILQVLAQDFNKLSVDAASKGRYDEAKSLALKAVEQSKASGDAKAEADAWTNLGKARIFAGDYPAGAQSFQNALAVARRAGDIEIEVASLTNLGGVHYFLGQYGEAFETFQTAQRIADAHPKASWSFRWRRLILVNRAALFQRLGQDERALLLYKEALEGAHNLPAQERGALLTNLGVCYRRLGDPEKAMQAFQSAQQLFVERGDSYGEMNIRKNQGILLALDLGDLEKARTLFAENATAAFKAGNRRELLQANLYLGEALYRQRSLADAGIRLSAALELARQLGTKEEEWKALYGLGRIAVRENRKPDAVTHFRAAVAVIESLRSGLTLSPLRSDFLADKQAVFDALIDLRKEDAAPDELFGLLEASRARNFQDRLRRGQPSLELLQRALPPGTSLVSYWLYGDKGLSIQVTSASAAVRPFHLDPESIARLRQRLLERKGDAWKEEATTLGRTLVAGLDLANIRNLILVPDAELEAVPFEVLQRDGRMLLEQVAVSYVPASALLLRPAPARNLRWPWQVQISAFADPVFPSSGSIWSGPPLPALPGSAQEARTAASVVPGRSALFLGALNQKARFLDPAIRQVPILHIATHAVADTSNPERSQLLFSPALSAAPDPLYLRQLADLDMRGIDLTVLSACDTEVGRNVAGEGSQTLGRAFVAGGSRSVVTTLWRVEDRSTSVLMGRLYASLAAGKPKAEALRQAKLSLIREGGAFAHPGYWAPFLLLGDGENPIPLPVPLWAFPAGLIAAVTAGGLGRRLFQRRGW